MADKISLEDFKYSYAVSSDDDRIRLLESVHTYPERFSFDAREYADYLWYRRYELYSLVDVDHKVVLEDTRYNNRSYNHSVYIRPTGFKIYDSIGDEIGQGIYNYQEGLKLVQVYYVEFLEPPTNCRLTSLISDLFRYKFGEDIKISFV